MRGLRWLVVSLGAIAAGYWTGRHSVPGAFSSGPVPAAPIRVVPLAVIPPGAMTLRHRLALVMQNGGSHGPRLMVELYGLSAVELREALEIAES